MKYSGNVSANGNQFFVEGAFAPYRTHMRTIRKPIFPSLDSLHKRIVVSSVVPSEYVLVFILEGLPPTPVQLLYPVSRFSNVKSLQHLCRFRIRQLVRIDHIPDLPLPKYSGLLRVGAGMEVSLEM